MARNRTKLGLPETELEALVKELGLLAKKPSPLDEAELAKCGRLLSCEAVTNLMAGDGPNAKPPVTYAATAIEEAVENIEDEKDRLIALAMFALMSPAYKGQAVSKRKELLERDRTIMATMWDDRRDKVLVAVATKLRNPSPRQSIASGSHAALTRSTRPRLGIDLQAQQAAISHSAGLTTLFVRHFDQVLHGSNVPLRTPSQAYFFNSYIALVYGPWFETRGNPDGTLTFHQRYDDGLSKAALARIECHAQVLDSRSPLGPTRNLAISAVRALHFFAQVRATISVGNTDLLAFNELLPSVDGYQWVDQDGEPIDQSAIPRLMSVYDTWSHWLRNDLASGEAEGVTSITSASGALADLLGRYASSTAAIRTTARTLSHKAVSSYYDMPQWELLGDGKSLKQYADAFFDRETLALKQQL